MLLWTISVLFFFLAIGPFATWIFGLVDRIRYSSQWKAVQSLNDLLQEIEDCLCAGLIPNDDLWDQLKCIPDPWGNLSYSCFRDLRSAGGAILPTLRRLKSMAQDQLEVLSEISSRLVQSYFQAFFCNLLVPGLGFTIYHFVPGVEERFEIWLLACGLSLAFCGVGSTWLIQLGVSASWGGLRPAYRNWVLGVPCSGERLLSLIQTGQPPDIAWVHICDGLNHRCPELVQLWGYSVWEINPEPYRGPAIERVFVQAGTSIKKAIQVSLLEGRPCVERVEVVLSALKRDSKGILNQKISLLATQALKPLFLCVAPALLGLLGFALWLAFSELAGEGLEAF